MHTIAATARHEVDAHGHEGYDWRDFMTWAQGAIASLCRERVVLSRSTSSYNVVAKKRREVKMKQLGDLSKKLINVVRLVLDDTAKSLGLALPWEIDRARGGAAGMNASTDEGENAGTWCRPLHTIDKGPQSHLLTETHTTHRSRVSRIPLPLPLPHPSPSPSRPWQARGRAPWPRASTPTPSC